MGTIPAYFSIPDFHLWSADDNMSTTQHVLDAVGEKSAYIFQAVQAGDIVSVSFATAQMNTTGDLDVRIETISATDGKPTGTLVSAGAEVTQNILSTHDFTWFKVTLTTAPTVSKGDMLAVVFEVPSGSAFNGQLRAGYRDAGEPVFPYLASALPGWGDSMDVPMVELLWANGEATRVPTPGTFPVWSTDNMSIKQDSTLMDEGGNHFTLPFQCTVYGCFFELDLNGGNGEIVLYDSASSVLEAITIDNDLSSSTNQRAHFYLFAQDHVLLAGTTYRLVFKSLVNGVNTVLSTPRVFESGSYASQHPYGAGDIKRTFRKDTGSWAGASIQLSNCGFLVKEIFVPTNSGAPGQMMIGL